MRKLLAILAFASLAGCSKDSSTGPVSIVGTYSLQSVNGTPLPFIAQASDPKIEILSDLITINAGTAFGRNALVRTTYGTSASTTTSTDAGTYVVNGTAISFTFNSTNSTSTGTINNGVLVVAESGYSYAYTRQ
jgi:hypothetical protein